MAGGNSVRFTATIDDKVSSKLGIIGGKFDKTFGKGSAASLFGNVGAKAVSTGFGMIASAAGGAVGFLEDAFAAAQEDEVSQRLLATALKNNIPNWDGNTDALNAYIDAQLQHGFADDEVRASLGQLVGITHDASKATDLNTIAQDLARAKGLDLATATDIVGKAALGNGKALKSLGIDTHGAKDAMGLLKSITDNTKGSMDAYDSTMEGKVNISQKKFNEAMEKIGYVIMPVVSTVMQKLSDDWLPALGRGWDKVYPAIHAVLTVLGNVIDAIGHAIQGIKDFLAWAAKVGGPSQDEFYHPKAPGHAQGGMVGLNGPEMIMVGERGPEQVIANRSSGGSSGTGVQIVGVSQRDLDRIIDERMFVQIRRAAAGIA